MSEFAKGIVIMYNDKHRKTALKFLNIKKNEDNNMPNKYSILPAEIRYNKNLSFGEKVMYAEITACADENGVCTVTNEHFLRAFDKSTKWISNSITNLKRNGYIDVSIYKSKGNYRKIRLIPIVEHAITSAEKDVI